MKGCILGGAVLLLVIALAVCNALFVTKTQAALLSELAALPPVPDPTTTPARVAALRDHLESKEALLGISVSYTMIDKATEALRPLEASAASGDIMQYQATLAVLRDMLEDIGRLERLSLKNIL
ncbi:MAG: DUF4363 family protein [Clostridia bacterium]|nr:DUF4363 family protein [Clostridia bacterium]